MASSARFDRQPDCSRPLREECGTIRLLWGAYANKPPRRPQGRKYLHVRRFRSRAECRGRADRWSQPGSSACAIVASGLVGRCASRCSARGIGFIATLSGGFGRAALFEIPLDCLCFQGLPNPQGIAVGYGFSPRWGIESSSRPIRRTRRGGSGRRAVPHSSIVPRLDAGASGYGLMASGPSAIFFSTTSGRNLPRR